MEKLHSSKIFFLLHLFALLHLLRFSSLSLQSSAYTLPDKYFINCGSNSSVTVAGRNFVGDENSGFYAGHSSSVADTNSSTTATSLYKTARVFTKPSSYKLQLVQSGTHMVRLHFYPFSSPKNLFNARFDVSAAGFSLLSNFTAQNSPEIMEFLLTIEVGKFAIDFKPSPESSSFAFVNAIEAFLVPDNFILDYAVIVTSSGGNSTTYNDLLSRALRVVHRINVGGTILTQDNDTLWRNWVPDDDYLLYKDAATNSGFHSDRPHYLREGATDYTAPDLVYQTAKEMNNIDHSRGLNFFNISWRFSVSKNAPHFVRVHFCDIISQSLNLLQFNLYLYSNFSEVINPYERTYQLAAPFYIDFVVDSDNSGFMNISVGPRKDSNDKTAFLNGLEIMELIGGADDNKSVKKNRFLIVGLVVALVEILVLARRHTGDRLGGRKYPALATAYASISDRQPSINSPISRTISFSAAARSFSLGFLLARSPPNFGFWTQRRSHRAAASAPAAAAVAVAGVTDMSGRKRRDRPRTMDELLRQAQARTPTRDRTPVTPPTVDPPTGSRSPHSHPAVHWLTPSTPAPTGARSFLSTPVEPSASTATASSSRRTGSTTTSTSSSRGRGPARGISSWNSGTPFDVQFDDTFHPVGAGARQLISQLGHMVRDPHRFPLTVLDWTAFSQDILDRLWGEVKDNLRSCPDDFRPVLMAKCRKLWKDHKNKVKKDHWSSDADVPDLLQRVPRGVLPAQWPELVRYWSSKEAMAEAERHSQNRSMQGPNHKLGTRHVTQVRHQLREQGAPIDRMSVWMASRRLDHPEVAALVAQFEARLAQLPEEEQRVAARRDEIFHAIIGQDGHGYTLTYGTGIPRSTIARATASGASSSQGSRLRTDEEVDELIQSLQQQMDARVEDIRMSMEAQVQA